MMRSDSAEGQLLVVAGEAHCTVAEEELTMSVAHSGCLNSVHVPGVAEHPAAERGLDSQPYDPDQWRHALQY